MAGDGVVLPRVPVRAVTAHLTGWLTDEEIEVTRARIPSHMWDVEYELQEPSIEGRAIDAAKVVAAFDKTLGEWEGDAGEYIEVEAPDPDGVYVTGVDWAKSQDWTVVTTFRVDVRPWRCVAWIRLGRQPWPSMVAAYERRLSRFTPPPNDRTGYLRSSHDATGVGAVVDDYLEFEYQGQTPEPVVMVGQTRADLFSDYIAGIEDDAIRYPFIRWVFDEHRYCRVDDLVRSGRDFHPPDSVVAGAMAWRNREAVAGGVAAPVGAEQSSKWRRGGR